MQIQTTDCFTSFAMTPPSRIIINVDDTYKLKGNNLAVISFLLMRLFVFISGRYDCEIIICHRLLKKQVCRSSRGNEQSFHHH